MAYDGAGRQIRVENAEGEISSTVYEGYSGRTIATVDPLSHRTSLAYDNAGRQITTTDPAEGVDSTIFDDASRPTVLIDAAGGRTSFVYDNATPRGGR